VSPLSPYCSSSRIFSGRSSTVSLAFMIAALLICVPAALCYAGVGAALQRISRDQLSVTNGAVTVLRDGTIAIDTPSSRAVVSNVTEIAVDQIAEIRFRYLGPTKTGKPLASGELRRQIGLKLRAADSCNVIYVMWRIVPASRIAVSVKRNTGHSHSQCGAHGYESIAPQLQTTPRPIQPGEIRTLRAELYGTDLTVKADGKIAWQGMLPSRTLAGPPGLRTDNGRFVLEYFVGSGSAAHFDHR
jgi:hypothetical protein